MEDRIAHDNRSNRTPEVEMPLVNPGGGFQKELNTDPVFFSGLLNRHFDNLSMLEKDAKEEQISFEKLEYLIARVEEEVEIEGAVQNMFANFTAEEEFAIIERQEKEWEVEREKARMEEEIELLRIKAEMLEEVVGTECIDVKKKLVYSHSHFMEPLKREYRSLGNDSKEEETERDGSTVVIDKRRGLFGRLNSENRLVVFDDMLSKVKERGEKAKKALEDLEGDCLAEDRKRGNRERQMEKKEGEMAAMLKERETLARLVRERRDGSTMYLSEFWESFENECTERCKVQWDMLEDERDRLEERLKYYMVDAEEDKRKMEEVWREKEREMVKRIFLLESALEKKEVALLQEKGQFEVQIEAMEKKWNKERENLGTAIKDKEIQSEEKAVDWLHLVNFKEEELKVTLKTIGNTLSISNRKLLELKRTLRGDGISLPLLNLNTQNDCLNEGSRSQLLECENDNSNVESMVADMERIIQELARDINKELERRDKERMEARLGGENFEQERKAAEKKVSELLGIIEILKQEIEDKEARFEYELTLKNSEISNLRDRLKVKELEIETNLQRSLDEVLLLKEKVETERRRRRQVDIDMHRSKEMRDDRGIEKELGIVLSEMNDLGEGIKREEKASPFQIDAGSSVRNSLEWYGKAFLMGGEEVDVHLIPANTDLNKSRTGPNYNSRDREWREAMERIGNFDGQISEAMSAIQSLKEELDVKERELEVARVERETERVKDIKYEQLRRRFEEQSQKASEWEQREDTLRREKEELERMLEAERADTADALLILQGAVRELQWAMEQYKGKVEEMPLPDNRYDKEFEPNKSLEPPDPPPPKSEPVNNSHTSRLNDIDYFILDLKSKLEESKKTMTPVNDVVFVDETEKMGNNSNMWAVAYKGGKKRVKLPAEEKSSPHFLTADRNRASSLESNRYLDKMEKLTAQRSLLAREQRPFRVSQDCQGNSQSTNLMRSDMGSRLDVDMHDWLTARDTEDDRCLAQDFLRHDSFPLTVLKPPSRIQRKWLVDASWVQQVRKEQLWLRHQLEIQQHRVTILGQVEAENRWMEEALTQVLEQKKESDARALDLQQKDDPLGPALFSFVLHSLVSRVEERVPGLDVYVWYLDNGTIKCDVNLVLEALGIIEEFGPGLGAYLNHEKSEIWWSSHADNVDIFPKQIIHVPNHGVELLGSPIGSDEFVEKKVDKISEADVHLEEMDDAQIEVTLLCGCLGFGKIMQLLCSCPLPDILDVLIRYGDRLHSRVAGILRAPYLEADAWEQTSLMIQLRGIGITQTVPSAGPAFFGSFALMHDLIAAILRWNPDQYTPPLVANIAIVHGLLMGSFITYDDVKNVRKVQKKLTDEQHEVVWKSILAIGRLRHRVCLRGLSLPHANDWLFALPISALDQRVQSCPFRIMLRRRLGVPILGQPTKCPLCASLCDSFGDHVRVCRMDGDKTRHHNAVHDSLFLVARGAALPVEKEPKHLLFRGSQKPGDLVIRNFSQAFHASDFDISISDMLQISSLDHAAVDNGYVARVAHRLKLRKFERPCREANVNLFPMVWESMGGATDTVHRMIKSWTDQEADRCGLSRSRIRSGLYQRISLTFQWEYARMIMKRCNTQDSSWLM